MYGLRYVYWEIMARTIPVLYSTKNKIYPSTICLSLSVVDSFLTQSRFSGLHLILISPWDLTLRRYLSPAFTTYVPSDKFVHQIRSMAMAVASALVSARLDYANSILFGCPQKHISRLQRVQHALVRVVMQQAYRSSSSTELLKQLHWLPIEWRIRFSLISLPQLIRHCTLAIHLNLLIFCSIINTQYSCALLPVSYL